MNEKRRVDLKTHYINFAYEVFLDSFLNLRKLLNCVNVCVWSIGSTYKSIVSVFHVKHFLII